MGYYRVYSVVGWSLAVLFLLLGADLSNAQSAQCASSMTSCVLKLQNMGTPTTTAEFQSLCRTISQAFTCLYKMDADCLNTEAISKIKPLEFFYSFCKAVTVDGRCVEAIDCFSWMESASQVTDLSCSEQVGTLSCLQNKTQTRDSCSIDESQMSFAVVKNLTTDMCPVVEKQCAAADACMQLPGMPDLSSLESGNINQETLDKLKPIKFSMTDPGFYCRLMKTRAGCFVTHQKQCNFSDQYVQDMQARHDNLKQICPPDPSSKGGRLVPEISALVCLLSLLSLLRAFL